MIIMLGSLRPLPVSTAIPQICGNWPKHQVHNSISALPHLGSLTMLKGLKFKMLTLPDAIIMTFSEEKQIVIIIKCCFVWDLSWERRGLSLGWNAPRLLPDNERFTLVYSFPQSLKASPYGPMPLDKAGLTTGSVRFVHVFYAVVFDAVNVRQIH